MQKFYYTLQKIFFVFFVLCLIDVNAHAQTWRIKVYDSAVVHNDIVTLGDIAEPLGDLSAADWERLSAIQLFAAPAETGRAFQITRSNLEDSLTYVLGSSASYLLLPNSLAIQKGGALLREAEIMRLVQTSLQDKISLLDGRAELVDYRVPTYIFLPTEGQRVVLDDVDVEAGRISLKFEVRELDDSVVKSYTGSVFLNLWRNVPMLIRPHNRGDRLEPDVITFANQNVAYINGNVWDGMGGPWQFTTSVGVNEPIMMSDLAPLATVRRGQLVNIVYERGSVLIVQQGEAQEDGAIGDIITVENTASGVDVFGTVVDNQTVRIQ